MLQNEYFLSKSTSIQPKFFIPTFAKTENQNTHRSISFAVEYVHSIDSLTDISPMDVILDFYARASPKILELPCPTPYDASLQIVRLDVDFKIATKNVDSFIGRAAHIMSAVSLQPEFISILILRAPNGSAPSCLFLRIHKNRSRIYRESGGGAYVLQ